VQDANLQRAQVLSYLGRFGEVQGIYNWWTVSLLRSKCGRASAISGA
jgi:hypothetical protein